MPVVVKLGRRPAVADARVPFAHDLASFMALPEPPATINYYAGPEEGAGWNMLGNDRLGDCVPCAVAHGIQVITDYANAPLVPTLAETVAIYETQGYVPGDDATDQGSLMMGPRGVMQEWATNGFVIGGQRVKIEAYVQLRPDGANWRKALHYFNFLLLGINLPGAITAGDIVPFMWNEMGGQTDGHQIIAVGGQADGQEPYYDIISWGARYRATATWLAAVTEEAQAVYMPEALNAIGRNADGFDHGALLAAMASLRA